MTQEGREVAISSLAKPKVLELSGQHGLYVLWLDSEVGHSAHDAL